METFNTITVREETMCPGVQKCWRVHIDDLIVYHRLKGCSFNEAQAA